MNVHAHISGSVMVLQLSKDFEHYIDARLDVRTPNIVNLELVRHGQVQRRLQITKTHAPEKIIDWAEEWMQ